MKRKNEPFITVEDLVKLLGGLSGKRGRINSSTLTFQALRIAVNDELCSLERVLPSVAELLSKGGRMAVISFHSLEDRIVKNFLEVNKGLKKLNTGVIRPKREEIKLNPRARSAKMRVGEKISPKS